MNTIGQLLLFYSLSLFEPDVRGDENENEDNSVESERLNRELQNGTDPNTLFSAITVTAIFVAMIGLDHFPVELSRKLLISRFIWPTVIVGFMVCRAILLFCGRANLFVHRTIFLKSAGDSCRTTIIVLAFWKPSGIARIIKPSVKSYLRDIILNINLQHGWQSIVHALDHGSPQFFMVQSVGWLFYFTYLFFGTLSYLPPTSFDKILSSQIYILVYPH